MCTDDCGHICDINLQCCYDKCISSSCPGNDMKYYTEMGFVGLREEYLNWSTCVEDLPLGG